MLHGWPDSTACIHRSSSTSAALFRHASYMFCLWLRFIFCPLQLCHFEGALGSCFTLSLSLAPACCTERIDFSRWSNQLSASSSDTKETQKEKEATTIRLPVFAGLGVRKRPTPGACSDWLDIMRRQKSRIAHQRCKAEESSRGGPHWACVDSPLITESETKLPPEQTLTRRPAR